jgi:hypothetical protein
MLHMTLLAEMVQADREREIRNRGPRVPGIPTGLRHPRQELERAAETRPQRTTTASLGNAAVAGSR